MSDPLTESEDSQGLESLRTQESKIDKLFSLATGKLAMANNSDEAKQALSEWVFYYLAQDHLAQLIEKTEKGSVEGESVDDTIDSQDLYDQITKNGSWVNSKKRFQAQEAAVRVDFRNLRFGDARRMGLDPEMKYKKVLNLFSAGQPNDFQSEAWEELVAEKLELVPDKTAPYIHPNIDALKASIN